MATFAESLPALVGVALGAAGAMTSSLLSDRLRWRRDQAVRWDQRRLDAYMTFAATLKDITTLGFRLTAELRPASHSIPIDRTLGLRELAAANSRKTKDWEALLLLADEPCVTAARRSLGVRGGSVEQFEHLPRPAP
jgi:hypothetical protein